VKHHNQGKLTGGLVDFVLILETALALLRIVGYIIVSLFKT
jgi:hypothetical protein